MYGQIHMCARSLVLEKFGEEAWNKILEKSGADDAEHFMTFHCYKDSLTISLIVTISEVLGVPLPTVLEIFGEYFFTYCLQTGYDKMLMTLGDNIETFIQNLDSLHALLSVTYVSMDAPSFRLTCEPDPDVSGAIRLHYYSSRAGLYPIVVGVLKAVGRHIYDLDVKAEVVEINKAEAAQETYEHVTFRFFTKTRKQETGAKSPTSAKPAISAGGATDISLTYPPSTIVGAKDFCNIFPFHVAFNKNLELVQCGAKVQTMTNFSTLKHPRLDDIFTLLYPKMPLTFDHIQRFINSAKKVVDGSDELKHKVDTNRLVLKGQMVWLEENNYMVYIASLRVSSLTELQERGLYLSDIPVYDVTRELVLLNQQRIAEIDIAKKLDQTMAELKRTSSALEREKAKTEMLLSQMLPPKIAMQLRDGKKVQAEKFRQVTILFSDIVTFTNIAAAVQPTDIVSMLDEMYSRFDKLTTLHDVYKIRIGIHTGSVVAGVVGQKMPRYCLFGDTVNTASRMESNGIPACIHCSETTYRALQTHDYRFVDRGQIIVKGKGSMHTYFLIGNATKSIPLSEDFNSTTNFSSVATIEGMMSLNSAVPTPSPPVPASTTSVQPLMTKLPEDNCMTFPDKKTKMHKTIAGILLHGLVDIGQSFRNIPEK
ncbi:hypothetical protein NP493_222g01034 [Ridgeia piscesae]|uniref:guanylate cyclase n=1 Tax=Ridgeia piscesae TaxID=27915 RepID=A0AAD9P0G5_RIDPI|nr:hypothetical protein NP493_222g01034 [Ridgeia piscesae]